MPERAGADAIALRPTATLFLPREEFFALVQDHPAILHGLYAIAVRRHGETKLALEAGSAVVADDSLLAEGADDPVTLVEPVSARLEDTERPAPVRPRIKPLGRGTLALPKVTHPPRVSSSQTPPAASWPARNTLPLPPPLPRTVAPSEIATGRIALPPPFPVYAATRDGIGGAGPSGTMPPMSASIRLGTRVDSIPERSHSSHSRRWLHARSCSRPPASITARPPQRRRRLREPH